MAAITSTFKVNTPTARPVEKVSVQAPVEDRPNYVSIYASSIFAVSMAFLLGVGIPLAIGIDDWMGGMGVGAFSAFWGGPSFGVMVGSARVSAWYDAHEDAHF